LQTYEGKITLADLAELTGGTAQGDGNTVISGVCSIENPVKGRIAMVLTPASIAWNEIPELPSALIVSEIIDQPDLPQLIHGKPRLAFTHTLRHFYTEDEFEHGVDPNAFVSLDAKVDPTASIGPFAVIGAKARIGRNVIIGAGCYIGARSKLGAGTRIYPNVSILHDVTIGARCIVQSGVVIGGDGFGFTPTVDGNIKVPQIGRVEIGNDVEIGANSTIDRATLDATKIGNDVKIDNLVQVAHNVQIGDHTRIAAQVGLSGRTIIEKNVVIAGQAGFQNGIRVGEGSIVGGQAGVTRHVKPGSRISGYPARDHKEALLLLAAQNRLPDILRRLDLIEKRLEEKS